MNCGCHWIIVLFVSLGFTQIGQAQPMLCLSMEGRPCSDIVTPGTGCIENICRGRYFDSLTGELSVNPVPGVDRIWLCDLLSEVKPTGFFWSYIHINRPGTPGILGEHNPEPGTTNVHLLFEVPCAVNRVCDCYEDIENQQCGRQNATYGVYREWSTVMGEPCRFMGGFVGSGVDDGSDR